MTEQIPTPTPEQVRQWLGEFFGCVVTGQLSDPEKFLATQAARWGADRELEACCNWLDEVGPAAIPLYGNDLRIERRPKPKSQAGEALAVLDDTCDRLDAAHENIIRRALAEPEPERAINWPAYFVRQAAAHERELKAALANPEPEGPTEQEWDALVESAWDKYMTVGYQGERFIYERDFDTALGFVREELARWGNNTSRSN